MKRLVRVTVKPLHHRTLKLNQLPVKKMTRLRKGHKLCRPRKLLLPSHHLIEGHNLVCLAHQNEPRDVDGIFHLKILSINRWRDGDKIGDGVSLLCYITGKTNGDVNPKGKSREDEIRLRIDSKKSGYYVYFTSSLEYTNSV